MSFAFYVLRGIQDIAGMGHLPGFSHFLSEAALSEEKADVSDIQRTKADDEL